jgi:hypothetical protein
MAQPREYDPEIKDIADYVANKPIDSDLAVSNPLPPAAADSATPRCAPKGLENPVKPRSKSPMGRANGQSKQAENR